MNIVKGKIRLEFLFDEDKISRADILMMPLETLLYEAEHGNIALKEDETDLFTVAPSAVAMQLESLGKPTNFFED